MRCRYCARPLQKPDYVKKVQSLRKALDGIQAEFLMFDYEESFEQVAGPSVVGRDSDGNVTGFTAAQCALYTHIKNGWQVAVHPCFKKGGIIFRAKGAATKPNDAEAFADFFKLVMRDGETRGRRAGQKDVKPRWRRETTDTARHRQEILVAIRKIGREPVYRKDVARAIGVRAATLRDWVTEIGEEWDDLVNEALR
jgi:hypothetical protein